MEIARLYVDAQRSFVALFESLDPDDLAKPVPCSPEWTVRDVLSHAAGVTDDIANGRIDGAATDPWTAAQVERWRDTDAADLIAQWNGQIEGIAAALESFGEFRPVFDTYTHEQDIRGAVGRPGNRDSELVGLMVNGLGRQSFTRPLTLNFEDGATVELSGEGEPITLTGISRYEYVRSRLGRRSPEQVREYDWSSPLTDDELAAWFAFGPTLHSIDE